MTWMTETTLSDERAELVPLSHDHHAALVEAAADGELWKLWYTFVPSPDRMSADIDRRLGLETMVPFTILDKEQGIPVGMTTYLNIDAVNRRLEIGATWYRKSVQRSGLNTHVKDLMLAHAFEELDCIAVEFRTHFFNRQSRTAIERLGAKLDGILRSHTIMPDGSLRDTCVYSILKSEWPAVKSHLAHLKTR
ncbi:MAG: GNAT family protein [Sneathiella sp.]